MSIYFSGDEELSRRYLPIILSKAKAFESSLVARKLKQGVYSYVLENGGVKVFMQYHFGEMNTYIHAPSKEKVKGRVIEHKEHYYEWNFIRDIAEVNGSGLGAFLVGINIVAIPYKGSAIITVTEITGSDSSLYFDDLDDNAQFQPVIYNNRYMIEVISKSIIAMLTRYNFTSTYSKVVLENGDIVYSSIWTTTGFNPYVLPDKGSVISFLSGGDFVDSAVQESILQYTKSSDVAYVGRFASSLYNYSYFYLNSMGGAYEVDAYTVRDYFAKGVEIFAEFVGSQSVDHQETLTTPIDHVVNYMRYDTSIRISHVVNGAIVTEDAQLIDHIFSPYTDTNSVFKDETTSPPNWYPVCVAIRPYCAPKNTVFIFTEITTAADEGANPFRCLFTPTLMDPTPYDVYQLEANLFITTESEGIKSGTVTTPIIIENIIKWSPDGKKFLYKEPSFSIDANGCIADWVGYLPATGKLILYVVTDTPDIVAALTINDYSSSTVIWHSKYFDVVVVKGTSSQDGVYKLSGSSYSFLSSFSDEEPVFLSDDGTIIALKQYMWIDGVAFTCNECVGVFFDKSAYAEIDINGNYCIKTFADALLEKAPAGYNFHEMSEDSSFCVVSYYFQSPASATELLNALVIDFADGPPHFEECNVTLTQDITTVRKGRRYKTDAYIKPPWAIHFSTDDTIVRARNKAVVNTYTDAFAFRANTLNDNLRRHKHFWHHVIGVFERFLDIRGRIPYDVLNKTVTLKLEE